MQMGRWCVISCLAYVLCGFAAAQIQSIGVAGDGEYTRFTLTASDEIVPELAIIDGDDGRYIELILDQAEIAENAYLGEPTGGIAAYTIDTDRIIFELDQPMLVTRQMVLPPVGSEPAFRFVLDLSGVSAARYAKAATADARRRLRRMAADAPPASVLEATHTDTQSVASSPKAVTPPKQTVFDAVMQLANPDRYRIVIDPGHGGRDPGALSIIGGKESDIVLKAALELKRIIEADARFSVYLTRETDVYVEHEDRVSLARNWRADLFISLHADAAGAPTVSGASVYTISTRGEARIEGVSKKYGWELPFEDGTPDDVSDILQDLTLRETKSNSTVFAEILVAELGRAGPLLRNTHRRKNLFVLLAPDVPAVLVEIGFLTNRDDAKRLRSSSGRSTSAQAIYRAIQAYFDRKEIHLAEN